jgi:hypothetical protein
MDKLDQILLEAWNRVGERCRQNRVEALKRSRRRFKGVLTRPMRECCLVIRASDTRLSDPLMLEIDPRAVAEHRPHSIVLTGEVIRELTKPVTIPYPGVTYDEAAKRLGRTKSALFAWVQQGVFRVERYREFRYPENGRRRGRLPKGPRGQEILARERADQERRIADPGNVWNQRFTGGGRPYVWTPSPIDPNNFQGRAPHPVWGTMWQWQWEKMPANFCQQVQRLPRWRMHGGKRQFFGWEFICPGRVNRHGENAGCGRRCAYLYGPQSVWTLAKAIGEECFELPEDCGLAGQWFPGLTDTVAPGGLGTRSFACKHCWSVRSACMANDSGWNEFIAHISGGLLLGRDVPRPKDICPVKRIKRVYRWRARRPVVDVPPGTSAIEQRASA